MIYDSGYRRQDAISKGIIMSKSDLYQTKPIMLNRIKREAKALKKSSDLTHTQALDVAAKNQGFNHYHHAVKLWDEHLEKVKHCTEGIILIFESNEGEDFNCYDGLFKSDDSLFHTLKPLLLEDIGNELNYDEHDNNDGKTRRKDVVTKELIEEEYQDVYGSKYYFFCTKQEQFETFEELIDVVREYCFWGMGEAIINGKYIGLYGDPIEMTQKLKDF